MVKPSAGGALPLRQVALLYFSMVAWMCGTVLGRESSSAEARADRVLQVASRKAASLTILVLSILIGAFDAATAGGRRFRDNEQCKWCMEGCQALVAL